MNNKKSHTFPLLLFTLFIFSLSASCDTGPDPGSATITVHNNSENDVIGLLINVEGGNGMAFPNGLKSGDQLSFEIEFSHGHVNSRVVVEYTMNERLFTKSDEIGGIIDENGGHFSLREVRDGSILHIRITNDGYELSGGEPNRLP
jgi:hypothetical protein